MPRAYKMSWEGEPAFRWVKMFKGERYRIGCHELNLPRNKWTKEDSASAANAWWEATLATLLTPSTYTHPHAERLNELNAHQEYATRHGLHEEAKSLSQECQRIEQLPPDALPDFTSDEEARLDGLEALGINLPPDPVAQRFLLPTDAVWEDRFRNEKKIPTERTVGALVSKWLEERLGEARAGTRSVENVESLRWCMEKFTNQVGTGKHIDSVTADLWHQWYIHCSGQVAKRDESDKEGWSADTAQKIFSTARSFIRWCWERELLTALPRNLASKQHKFERPQKAIPTFSNMEIVTLLTSARDAHLLILLLMLNCGMTQKDVSDLKKTQIDLTAGRVTRRRSKTMKKKSSRLVSYKLWDEVAELMKVHMNTDKNEPRALVTKSGKPWVWAELTGSNTKKKSDNVATIFNNLKRKVKLFGAGKSLKVFRKTSATRLKGELKYRDLRYLFLGHSERTVADRHYAEESQHLLDEATDWLRTQYGIAGLGTMPATTHPAKQVNDIRHPDAT